MASLVSEWEWEVPPAYWKAKHNLAPRQIRKFAGGMTQIIRGEGVLKCAGVAGILEEVERAPATPIAVAWAEVDEWLLARGHQFSVEGQRPLCSLWTSQDALPPNLEVAVAMSPALLWPDGPPQDSPQEEKWRLYSLHTCPPVGEAIAGQFPRLHKSCSRWGPGWQLHWHGSNIYGVASALAFGEVLPSELAGRAHGTACGRGAYTSRTFKRAVRYGTTHYFPAEGLQKPHPYVAKMVLLVAVPGQAPEALPLATWSAVDRTGMGKAEKKRSRAFALDVQDDRLDKRKMRQGESGTGAVRERDWTTSAEDTADQFTSSRGYVMALGVGLMLPRKASRYLQEGKIQDDDTRLHGESRAAVGASIDRGAAQRAPGVSCCRMAGAYASAVLGKSCQWRVH